MLVVHPSVHSIQIIKSRLHDVSKLRATCMAQQGEKGAECGFRNLFERWTEVAIDMNMNGGSASLYSRTGPKIAKLRRSCGVLHNRGPKVDRNSSK
jgi:hypothetical protein